MSTPKQHPRRPQPQATFRGQKRPKEEDGSYWMYGVHPCMEALRNPKRTIRRVLLTDNRREAMAEALAAPAATLRAAPESVNAGAIARLLTADAVHQGIAMLVEPLNDLPLKKAIAAAMGKPFLVLDQVSDPHNIGAVLRSAAAFEAGALLTTWRHAPGESGVLAKSASGALELMPWVRVTNLAEAIRELQAEGYYCIGMESESPYTLADAVPAGRPVALVLGAEGKGLRQLTGQICDALARLPISPRVESLNVSNAAAVALYHLAHLRQVG